MGKLVLWLALAGAVWIGWTLWRIGVRRAEANARKRSVNAPAPPKAEHTAAEPSPEPMVRCGHCALYLPASDSVAGSDGTRFCSPAHRDAAGAKSDRHR